MADITNNTSNTTNDTNENSNRHTCVVKWFNSRHGYGFITNLDNNDDYFAHQSQLQPKENCFKTLYPGEYVECESDYNNETNKTQAINITGIRDGTLLCEHRNNNNNYRKPSDYYSNNYEKKNRY